MKNRIIAGLMAAVCLLLSSCGDVDESSSKKDKAELSSQAESITADESTSESSGEEQQSGDEKPDELSDGDIYEQAGIVTKEWCGYIMNKEFDKAKAICTDSFASELDDLYDDVLYQYTPESINGLNYDGEEDPYIGINMKWLDIDEHFLGYTKVVMQGDSFLIDGCYMRDDDDKPVECLDYFRNKNVKAAAQWLLVKTNEKLENANVPDGEYASGDGSEVTEYAKAVMDDLPGLFSLEKVTYPDKRGYKMTVKGGKITNALVIFEYGDESYSSEYTG